MKRDTIALAFPMLATMLVGWTILPVVSIAQEQARWWQREIASPSPGQIINPDYLTKKRELERAWDDFRDHQREEARFRSMGQKTAALQAGVQDSWRKVNRLEFELSRIPIYVQQQQGTSNDVQLPQPAAVPNQAPNLVALNNQQEIVYGPSGDANLSVIRVQCAGFPYRNDPAGMDYASYEQLRDVTVYRLRLYPEKSMSLYRQIVQSNEELKVKNPELWKSLPRTILPPSEKYGKIGVQTTNGIIENRRQEVEQHLQAGNPLEVEINGRQLPPFVLIPVPPGVYYVEYSLEFGLARKVRFVHPNYPGRSADHNEKNTVRWGPPRIVVRPGQIAAINFRPTSNINGQYTYKGDWEGSAAHWDFLDYLWWTGEWQQATSNEGLPSEVVDLLKRVDAFCQRGEWDKAIAEFDELMQRAPNDPQSQLICRLGRGLIYNQKCDYDKAVAEGMEAIQIKPDVSAPYVVLGNAFLGKGDNRTAITNCDQAIRRDAACADAYVIRSAANNNLGDYDRVIADCTEALRLNPQHAGAYWNWGMACSKRHEYGLAVAKYTEAIRLNPKCAMYYNQLAWLQATCPDQQHRDGKKAVENAMRANELNGGTDANSNETLAAAYAEAGDFEKARQWQTKAVEGTSEQNKNSFRARLALYEQGQPYREESK